MEWKYRFEHHILDRAFDYYLEGRVRALEASDHQVRAFVEGSETYEVTIELEAGEPSYMSCDCPYAQEGRLCKHMAAVLFHVEVQGMDAEAEEDSPFAQEVPAIPQDPEAIVALVDEVDEEILRDFLKSLLRQDNIWFMRFWAKLHPSSSFEDPEYFKRQIRKLAVRYERLYEQLDEEDADWLTQEILGIFDQGVAVLKSCGRLEELYGLSVFLLDSLDGLVDPYSEIGDDVFASCHMAWLTIYLEGDTEDRLHLLQGLSELIRTADFPGLDDSIERFVYPFFDEDPYIDLKAQLIENRIKRVEEEGWAESHYGYGLLGNLYITRLDLMEKSGASWEAITDSSIRQWRYDQVRLWYAQACERRGDLDRAIQTLEESREMEQGSHQSMADIKRGLARLYKITGQKEKYLATLWELASQDDPRDKEIYQELRAQYGEEEWPEQRDKLLEQLTYPDVIEYILLEEGLIERLLTLAVKEEGLVMIARHKKTFLALDPQAVVNKYVMEIQRMAEYASGRSRYRDLVALLRQLKGMPGGAEQVDLIVGQWRQAYRRRYAMQQELDKL